MNLKFFFILISFTFCNAKVVFGQNSTEIKKLTETFETESYSIEYPSTWELNTSIGNGAKFFLLSMLTSPNDQFRENINLMIEDLADKDISLNYYVESAVNQLSKFISRYKLIENKRMFKHDIEFQKVVYSGQQGVFKLIFEQYVWVFDDKAYVLTFTCEKSQIDSYKEIGESILDSFMFKD